MTYKNSFEKSLILFFIISFIGNKSLSQCPWVEGVLVNSCSASEGINEMVNFKTGSSPLSINSLFMTFATAGNWCNSGCGSNTWANGSTYFNSSIVTDCTAPGVFINVNNTSGTIPANAQVLVFTGNNPTFDYNMSALCNSGPYYIVFANNTNTTGRFANNATTTRTISLSDGSGCNQSVNYLGSNFANNDGDYVRFNQSGTPTYMNLASCIYSTSAFPIVLPLSIISFSISQNKSTQLSQLNWTISQNHTISRFEIMKSEDGITFLPIGYITPQKSLEFEFIDTDHLEIAYYFIQQVNLDGSIEQSPILRSKPNKQEFELDAYYFEENIYFSSTSVLPKTYDIDIYDAMGKHVDAFSWSSTNKGESITHSVSSLSKGIYFLKAETISGSWTKRLAFH